MSGGKGAVPRRERAANKLSGGRAPLCACVRNVCLNVCVLCMCMCMCSLCANLSARATNIKTQNSYLGGATASSQTSQTRDAPFFKA